MRPKVCAGLFASTFRALVVLSVALAILAGAAHAQSGRRLPNRSDSPPASTSSAPPATAEQPPPTKSDKPKQQLLVTRYLNSSFSNYYSDLVTRACLDRLKEGASASVSLGREMNRKEASDFAKNTTDTHVLWIEWTYDGMPNPQTDQSNLDINFVLFIPGTGKIKTSGRVHPSDYRNRTAVGGVGIPIPIPNGTAALEYMLKESGREIADRVISSLNIGRPNH